MPLRDTIVGAATGVTLLAGVFGFAVGLPEATGDEPAASEEKPASVGDVADLLPETILDGGLVTFESIDPEFSALTDQVEGFGTDKLTEVFGTDVAVGIYTTPGREAQVAVTIYDGESGLFLQDGPPVPPEMTAGSQTTTDTVRQGDSVCIGQWQTEALTQGAPPFQVQCQRVVGGVTVNVYAVPGLTVEQVADIVDDVVAQAGLA